MVWYHRTMSSDNPPVAAYPFLSKDGGHNNNNNISRSIDKSSSVHGYQLDTETAALCQLKAELAIIPDHLKSELVHAQRVAPDLVDDEHLSKFLHAENFNCELAAKRVVAYWTQRSKVFGWEDYTLPLTSAGAIKKHVQSIQSGWLTLLPQKDNHGRAILFCDPILRRNSQSSVTSDDLVRLWWYLLHIAMEDDVALKNGFIIISNARNTSLNNFDPRVTAAICTSGDRIFPIRWRQTHCCHSNPVFPLVAGMVKAVLSRNQRDTFILHNGQPDAVLQSLSANGIPKECLPSELGGLVTVSPDIFIRERMAIEGVEDGGFKSEESNTAVVKRSMSVENEEPEVEAAPQPSKQNKRKTPTTKKKKQIPTKQASHPGRHGDPRMNAAVQAKLENPDLPLLDALATGGFVFKDMNKPGVKSSEAKDAAGVTVYQRRNQLLRRLRKERQRNS